jgi:hypothetical protein
MIGITTQGIAQKKAAVVREHHEPTGMPAT